MKKIIFFKKELYGTTTKRNEEEELIPTFVGPTGLEKMAHGMLSTFQQCFQAAAQDI